MRRTHSLSSVADLLLAIFSTERQQAGQCQHHQYHYQFRQYGRYQSITATRTSSAVGGDPMATSTGRSSSVGDLLTSSGGTLCDDHGDEAPIVVGGGAAVDEFDSSWCSVDNLETDCVSPRVSTNSLFSQIDSSSAAAGGGTSSTWDESYQDYLTAPSCGHQGATSSSPDPTGNRCLEVGAADHRHCFPVYYSKTSSRRRDLLPVESEAARYGQLQQQQVSPMLYRQMTAGCRGIGSVGPPSYGARLLMSSARSISCPSIITRCIGSVECQRPEVVPDSSSAVVDGERQESDSQEKREAHDSALVREEPTSLSIQAPAPSNTSTSSAGQLSWRSSRSASPPSRATIENTSRSSKDATAPTTESLTWRCRRSPATGGRSSATCDSAKERKAGHVTGNGSGCNRVNRSLAQTKCIQWLNSFDEDD